jgi:hypothetical protein
MRRMDTAMADTAGFVQVFRSQDAVVYRYQNPEAKEAP